MGRIFGARTGLFSITVPLFLAALAFPAETVIYSYTAGEAPTLSNEAGEAVFATTLFSAVTGQPRLPMVVKSFLVPIDADVGSVSARMRDIHEEIVSGTFEAAIRNGDIHPASHHHHPRDEPERSGQALAGEAYHQDVHEPLWLYPVDEMVSGSIRG